MTTHFERLTKSMSLMALNARAVGNQYYELSCYPEVVKEHIWVNQMVARATVPLMREVISCMEDYPKDELHNILTSYMRRHIAEETDHDEWYVNDLELLGLSREEIFSRPPTPNVAALSGSQYYWIKHHHPVAFMGYLGCLEVYHPTVEYVEGLIKNSGLPAKAFSTVMEHAVIDAQHKEDIIETINSLPLTEVQYQAIELSAFQTFRYVAKVMEDICRVAPKQQTA
ncbi:iron-containing redox enzyme family protein [Thalassotalea sediminis]|uniref:iron-containing redox enzyme family protein n=1 Tax=Thalassotalea sediminis TaxID=1759089 RepID=UPI002572BF45|nr:iron-containing redox enzyme family protein [Thalassotalea sediminis]